MAPPAPSRGGGALSFWGCFYTISALMKSCMADLTRLLARTLGRALEKTLGRTPTPGRQGRGVCAPNQVTAGFSHTMSTFGHTGAQATSMRTAWQVMVMTGVVCLGLLGATPTGAWARQGRHLDEARDTAPHAQAAVGQTTAVVALTALPRQAQDVHRRILAGGPFRYQKDGVVFGNRERLLPRQPRGFYREYTVPTPGERDRGARRIVCGGKEVRQPETCFYTGDHYASFQTIDPRQ